MTFRYFNIFKQSFAFAKSKRSYGPKNQRNLGRAARFAAAHSKVRQAASGFLLIIDVMGDEDALVDAHMQALELLRELENDAPLEVREALNYEADGSFTLTTRLLWSRTPGI